MNLYLISQSYNDDYDTFDSAIVCAESTKQARWIHPRGYIINCFEDDCIDWCYPKLVKVKLIGTSKIKKPGVVLASFNAG